MKESVASLIGFVIIGFLLVACDSAPTFEEAVKDPSSRQSYIQKILEQHPAPLSVKRVEYATPEILEELKRVHEFVPPQDTLMATNPIEDITVLQVGTRELPVRISIFSAAFDSVYVQNEQDFLASLLHEYDHAWHLNSTNVAGFAYAGSFQIMAGEHKGNHSITLINIVMELDAFQKEIDRVTSENWGSSQLYIENRYKLYTSTYLDLLRYFEEGPSIDPQIEKRMKVDFFALWFPKTTVFSLTQDGEPKLTDPITKRSYILPEEVLYLQESR